MGSVSASDIFCIDFPLELGPIKNFQRTLCVDVQWALSGGTVIYTDESPGRSMTFCRDRAPYIYTLEIHQWWPINNDPCSTSETL